MAESEDLKKCVQQKVSSRNETLPIVEEATTMENWAYIDIHADMARFLTYLRETIAGRDEASSRGDRRATEKFSLLTKKVEVESWLKIVPSQEMVVE